MLKIFSTSQLLITDVYHSRYILHFYSRRFPLSQNTIRSSQCHFNNSSHPKTCCSVPPKRHIETVADDALHGLIAQHRSQINISFPKTSSPLSKTKPQSVQLSLRLTKGSCTNIDERHFLASGAAVKLHGGEGEDVRWWSGDHKIGAISL